MDVHFIDRILTCSDCHGEFIFTAGEQLFFSDKQFKNDPKRCKPCKSRRSGLAAAANGTGLAAAGISRTETRTECSDCGVQTTVPFKPTQGRPVLCRQCFQSKAKAAKPVAETTVALAGAGISATSPMSANIVSALTEASATTRGRALSADAATLAMASMSAASPGSCVASAADLASISVSEPQRSKSSPSYITTQLLAASRAENISSELMAAEVLEA